MRTFALNSYEYSRERCVECDKKGSFAIQSFFKSECLERRTAATRDTIPFRKSHIIALSETFAFQLEQNSEIVAEKEHLNKLVSGDLKM